MGIINKYTMISALLLNSIIVSAQNYKIIQGHEYVDMGLSVNWATCNIGASSPEGYGDYFAWGETFSKSCYNIFTYSFTGENIYLDYTKYIGDIRANEQNKNDNKLELIDDVANVQWGKPWRIPTSNEIEELVNSCDWVLDERNGVKGCWAISRINGNKLFFPLAGQFKGDEFMGEGMVGKYWASEIDYSWCGSANELWLWYDDEYLKKLSVSVAVNTRETGISVRAVVDKRH